MKRVLLLIALTLVGCGSDPAVIHDTDPFLTVDVQAPYRSEADILNRSGDFAGQHGMKLESSTSHFEAGEYSALLKRVDLNIFVSNVGRGRTTLLSAYVRGKPTDAQRRLVEDYQCKVFYLCRPEQQPVAEAKRDRSQSRGES